MADPVSTFIDDILSRVRDPQATATPRATVLEFLSHAQRLWNYHTRSVFEDVTLTVEEGNPFLPVSGLIPDCYRIVSIRHLDRDIVRVPSPDMLYAISLSWFRDKGPRIELWAEWGPDLVVLYPTLTTNTSLTVRYVKVCAPLLSELDTLEVPEHEAPMVVTLAESFVNLRKRDVQEAVRLFGQMPFAGKGMGDGQG